MLTKSRELMRLDFSLAANAALEDNDPSFPPLTSPSAPGGIAGGGFTTGGGRNMSTVVRTDARSNSIAQAPPFIPDSKNVEWQTEMEKGYDLLVMDIIPYLDIDGAIEKLKR